MGHLRAGFLFRGDECCICWMVSWCSRSQNQKKKKENHWYEPTNHKLKPAPMAWCFNTVLSGLVVRLIYPTCGRSSAGLNLSPLFDDEWWGMLWKLLTRRHGDWTGIAHSQAITHDQLFDNGTTKNVCPAKGSSLNQVRKIHSRYMLRMAFEILKFYYIAKVSDMGRLSSWWQFGVKLSSVDTTWDFYLIMVIRSFTWNIQKVCFYAY